MLGICSSAIVRQPEPDELFQHASAAQRYAAARPFFHPVVRDRIVGQLGAGPAGERALDVACGTGQSTCILAGLARFIVGADRSREMLSSAAASPGIRFVQSSAEHLSFVDESFDLITVALAFHWLNRNQFLDEVSRLLRPAGWFIIYDNSFHAHMQDNPSFETWFKNRYLERYPSPPRDRAPLIEEDALRFGLSIVARETYLNEVEFSREELTAYLMTQSNVIAAIEEGIESEKSVRNWLFTELFPYFSHDRGRFVFGGPIMFLRNRG